MTRREEEYVSTRQNYQIMLIFCFDFLTHYESLPKSLKPVPYLLPILVTSLYVDESSIKWCHSKTG